MKSVCIYCGFTKDHKKGIEKAHQALRKHDLSCKKNPVVVALKLAMEDMDDAASGVIGFSHIKNRIKIYIDDAKKELE